jgi:hypothetical protein
MGQDGNWVALKLEGKGSGSGTSNTQAIGARIEVETSSGLQVFTVDGGHGHYGIQHDSEVHIGLGTACEAKITVRWPNTERQAQSFEVQSGYRYGVKEGEDPKPRVP